MTGDNTERVDTRVLKMVYEVAAADTALYVGQQLYVFLSALPEPAANSGHLVQK